LCGRADRSSVVNYQIQVAHQDIREEAKLAPAVAQGILRDYMTPELSFEAFAIRRSPEFIAQEKGAARRSEFLQPRIDV
jgi:hypothetical protein